MPIDVLRFAGKTPGPRLLFLGGVHGEEKPGTLSLEALAVELKLGRLKIVKGEIVIAPRVNAAACAENRHFLDENLNRIVRPHHEPKNREQALANELVALIDEADAVLDLHGMAEPTAPFAFLDDEGAASRAWCDALGVSYLLAGWPELYAGQGAVTTTERAQARGKPALTVEVGRNDDPSCAAFGLACARRTLEHFGLAARGAAPEKPRLLRLTGLIRREREGVFARPWKNFDPVRRGEPLVRYADGAEIRAKADGCVVMPFAGAALGCEWLYLAV